VVRLWSRTARDWSTAFTGIVGAIRRLAEESFTIDGEVVCVRPDGLPDFHALRSEVGCRDARLIAFDLLVFDGWDLRGLPLYERRMLLQGLVRGASDQLWFSADFADAGDLFRHACAMGLEDIVSKRRDSPYRSGRYDGWRKILSRTTSAGSEARLASVFMHRRRRFQLRQL
jgi:bifunctional non-homologous end joining protein LigD